MIKAHLLQTARGPGAWLSGLASTLLIVGGTAAQAGTLDRRPVLHAETAGNSGLCLAAIQDAEQNARLPLELLDAIGLVESGRVDPETRRTGPWPWTINVAGDGRFFETKAEAIAAVETAQAAGIQSIDVGCLQVNLMYHPAAFASLEQAFDPHTNAVYAASFLKALFGQSGDWSRAAGAYHSQTPGLSEDYARRVVAAWPLAARYGVVAPAGPFPAGPFPAGPGLAGHGVVIPAVDPIDPHGVLTPAFRAQLARNLADRAHWEAMGLVPRAATEVATLRGTARSRSIFARLQRPSVGG